MKTVIHNGKIYVSETEKPWEQESEYFGNDYQEVLKQWEEGLLEVENWLQEAIEKFIHDYGDQDAMFLDELFDILSLVAEKQRWACCDEYWNSKQDKGISKLIIETPLITDTLKK